MIGKSSSSSEALSAATLYTNNNITIIDDKLYSVGGFYETSDERLKHFKENIKVDLDSLSKLRKSYFTFIDNNEEKHIGVSAQEVQKLYPELVSKNENGYLVVDYAKLSVVALRAIDILYQEIKNIKTKLKL